MIEASRLSKTYKKKLAVDNVSLKVEVGKVTGFLGPNGAGKSTTIRLMLGLDNGKGKTTFDKKRLYEYSQPSSVVGILLEAKAFHPTRSAYNHLRVLATAGGIPKKRIDEVLEIVGLSDVAHKNPGKFSLGMSQRLGIAAAILGKPKYLILDEPANGLDPEGIAWLRQFLKDYAAQGNAVFVSSHLLSEMAQMADNVVVIGKGKLLANTSISDLIAGKGQKTVFVRAAKQNLLKKMLEAEKLSYVENNNGFKVSGLSTDKIGQLAFAKKIPILELSNLNPSLEEVFLEITEGAEEYQGNVTKGSKQ